MTKRGRPFVVIMDAKRYEELIANQKEISENAYTVGMENEINMDSGIEALLKAKEK